MYRSKNDSRQELRTPTGIPVQGYSIEERERIKEALSRQLGPEFISKRKGPGYNSIQYLEGWKAINLANDIFGPMGWCSELRGFQVDYIEEKHGATSMGLSCNVRVVLKDGTYHEDIGYGSIENCRSKAMAFDKCKKEAMTDGLKRALRQFGNALGNCLYDKEFLKQIQNIKSEPNALDETRLFRRTTANNDSHLPVSNVYEKRKPSSAGSKPMSSEQRIAQRPRNSRRRDSNDDDSFVFSDDMVLDEVDNTANPTMRPEDLPDSDPEFDDDLTPAEMNKLIAATAVMSTQQQYQEQQQHEKEKEQRNEKQEQEQEQEQEKGESDKQMNSSQQNNATYQSAQAAAGLDQSVSIPELVPEEVTFVSAISADKIIEDPSLQGLLKYDASAQPKGISKSSFINHSKSLPVKRTQLKPNPAEKENLDSITPVVLKRSFGLPFDKLPNKRLHK